MVSALESIDFFFVRRALSKVWLKEKKKKCQPLLDDGHSTIHTLLPYSFRARLKGLPCQPHVSHMSATFFISQPQALKPSSPQAHSCCSASHVSHPTTLPSLGCTFWFTTPHSIDFLKHPTEVRTPTYTLFHTVPMIPPPA